MVTLVLNSGKTVEADSVDVRSYSLLCEIDGETVPFGLTVVDQIQ